MTDFWNEARITLRGLTRRPGLALGIMLTIGLGIGATTTIYGIVDGVILKPLPYEDPDRLVAVGMTASGAAGTDPETGLQTLARISTLDLQGLRERSSSYSSLGAVQPFELVVSEAGADEVTVPAARFSEEAFSLLGVSPALGRTFLPEEFAPAIPGGAAAPRVALISHDYWLSRYGGDPGILGTPLEPAGGANPTAGSEIVGVLPRGFVAPEAFFPVGAEPNVIVPLPEAMVIREADRVMVTAQSAFGIGRLAAAATAESAREEARSLMPEITAAAAMPLRAAGSTPTVIGVNGLHEQTVGTAARSLWIFLGAAGLLLLLATLNATTLLLSRALDRSQELGVRTALGAGRARIVGLLVGEAGVLTLAGGVLGILAAYAGVAAFLRFAPDYIPRLGTIAVNGRVLAVAAAVSIATGLLVGLVPALRATARAPWERLRRGGRTVSEARSPLRAALIGGQLAAAVVLLSGAGLLFNSFLRVRNADPGFEVEGLVAMGRAVSGPIQISRSSGTGPVQTSLWQRWDPVLQQVAAVPGVRDVVGASGLPFQSPAWTPRVILPGDDPAAVREGIAGYAVTPGFFEGMGIEVLRGRGIETTDASEGERVVVVNEAFVRTQLEGREPLGLTIERPQGGAGGGSQLAMRIVGVVEDVVQARASDGPRPAIYIPYTQADIPQLGNWQLAFRTDLPLEGITTGVRAALAAAAAEPPRDLSTMADRIAATHVTPRFQALLIGAFALVALVLAAMGLYGSLAQSVRWRQKEIGIRMALGADRGQVLGMVLRDGMKLSIAGLVVGLVGTLALSRVVVGLLYGVEPTDPVTLAVVSATLLAAAALASLAPARRATTVDPVQVLASD